MENKIFSSKREFKINGTSVWFNFDDQMFINNLFKWISLLEDKPDFKEGTDIKTISENLDKMNLYLKKYCDKFDELFGIGSCEKVFGCKMPTIDAAAEFILLAVPLIEECFEAKEEYQKQLIEKYGNRAKRRLVSRK